MSCLSAASRNATTREVLFETSLAESSSCVEVRHSLPGMFETSACLNLPAASRNATACQDGDPPCLHLLAASRCPTACDVLSELPVTESLSCLEERHGLRDSLRTPHACIFPCLLQGDRTSVGVKSSLCDLMPNLQVLV